MKVTFVIVYSSLNTPTKLYTNDLEVTDVIVQHTKGLLSQFAEIKIDKEIILVDNTGDFDKEFRVPDMKVVLGPQYFLERNLTVPYDWYNSDNIKDLQISGHNHNHAAFASMGFQAGVEEATGDYIIMQHNDTKYLFNYYSGATVIQDSIKLLEDNKYAYITVDKKPRKETEPLTAENVPDIEYFADCYWFLCRRNFYRDNHIHVDWTRGDTNHLATIKCAQTNQKYLHLPGYYEIQEFRDPEWVKNLQTKYPLLLSKGKNIHTLYNKGQNIHTLYDIPFLVHVKGGTGLGRKIIEANIWS